LLNHKDARIDALDVIALRIAEVERRFERLIHDELAVPQTVICPTVTNRASSAEGSPTQAWGEITRGDGSGAVTIDSCRQRARPHNKPCRVDTVRRVRGVPLNAVGRASQQPCRPHGVSSLRMRHADGELGKTTPQFAFVLRRRFPGPLQHLVRVERAASVEQPLRLDERRRRRQRRLIGNPLNAGRITG
jgi:hypothetical protein